MRYVTYRWSTRSRRRTVQETLPASPTPRQLHIWEASLKGLSVWHVHCVWEALPECAWRYDPDDTFLLPMLKKALMSGLITIYAYSSSAFRPNSTKLPPVQISQAVHGAPAWSAVWWLSCLLPISQDPWWSTPAMSVDLGYIKTANLTRIYFASGYMEYSSEPYIAAG